MFALGRWQLPIHSDSQFTLSKTFARSEATAFFVDFPRRDLLPLSIFTFEESVDYNGPEWAHLIQMTITSTTVGKNLLEEIE